MDNTRKLNWLDMLIYRLFYWRWNPILKERKDLAKAIADSLYEDL